MEKKSGCLSYITNSLIFCQNRNGFKVLHELLTIYRFFYIAEAFSGHTVHKIFLIENRTLHHAGINRWLDLDSSLTNKDFVTKS